MQDVLAKDTVITLGTPSVYLSSLNGSNGVHTPPYFSHVRLCFTHKERGVINLYDGHHPHLNIGKSDLRLSFRFGAYDAQEDVGKLFESAIIAETERMIRAACIRIKRGKPAPLSRFYHFEVTKEGPLNGLVIDPNAYAHHDWFEE